VSPVRMGRDDLVIGDLMIGDLLSD